MKLSRFVSAKDFNSRKYKSDMLCYLMDENVSLYSKLDLIIIYESGGVCDDNIDVSILGMSVIEYINKFININLNGDIYD